MSREWRGQRGEEAHQAQGGVLFSREETVVDSYLRVSAQSTVLL